MEGAIAIIIIFLYADKRAKLKKKSVTVNALSRFVFLLVAFFAGGRVS